MLVWNSLFCWSVVMLKVVSLCLIFLIQKSDTPSLVKIHARTTEHEQWWDHSYSIVEYVGFFFTSSS